MANSRLLWKRVQEPLILLTLFFNAKPAVKFNFSECAVPLAFFSHFGTNQIFYIFDNLKEFVILKILINIKLVC